MPEYLAPGVYIEETSFRSKSIEGVSTSTAGFAGPCRYGPVRGEPEILTSFSEFERIYGGLDQLVYSGSTMHNYLAHAVRAFFEEGGKRLYVSRVANGGGFGTFAASSSPPEFEITARFPGVAGNFRLTFTAVAGANALIVDPLDSNKAKVRRIKQFESAFILDSSSPPKGGLYDLKVVGDDYEFSGKANAKITVKADGTLTDTGNNAPDKANYRILPVTVNVAIERPIARPKRPEIRYGAPQVIEGMHLNPEHPRALTKYFTQKPINRIDDLLVPFAIATDLTSGHAIGEAILGTALDNLANSTASVESRSVTLVMTNGTDGTLPDAAAYQGNEVNEVKSGLLAFEDIEDISIVAAPGYSANYNAGVTRAESIQGHLIGHCEKMRYRIAVLDSGEGFAISSVRQQRGKIDTTHAALYYPWVRLLDPITEDEIFLPPSGFVAGIYARNDVDHGVHKAPANEVVRLSIGFELLLNKSQQDVLNPEGVNCFRFFEGRGYRLWGARTASSDPEWKYVNLRRYFAFLERSIDKGTQWAVFEPNNDQLWFNVRRTIEDFLFNEWKSNHLLGLKPEEAYFVRCDRSTMTQNDLDNGRLICLVGVAPVRPAEFVIFRIGQWTADSNR